MGVFRIEAGLGRWTWARGAGVKYLVCAPGGGPQRYSGKSMSESHAHLDILQAV